MAYFETFPMINYTNDNLTFKQTTDLFRRVKIKEKILDEASLYQEYDVPNGERPEDTSMKHFGDPQYHWVRNPKRQIQLFHTGTFKRC